ncbi:Death-associated protein kinase dapk-1 [Trichinella sp. T6]|nr:Death-associated protein kinase dapk-1 [Trichinella sp. T6]
MWKMKSLSLPKNLDLGKRRLIKLLDELHQLLEECAALREIEEQLRTSEEHYRQVEESQEEFETTLNYDDVDSAMDEWAKFQTEQSEIDELRAVDVVPGSIRSAEADRNVRLPQCALPKFDGDVTKLQEFWDQFESSVHQQRDLSDAVELVYLRDCLTGDALRAIAGLSAANADYQVAVRRLKERFDRLVVATRRLLLNLVGTPIREWDVKALSNHIDRNLDALTALGKDPRTEALTAAECLITVAQELLPEQARIKWDEQTMEDESAQSDFSRFTQFLRNQAELMQHSHRPSSIRLTPSVGLSSNLEGDRLPTPSVDEESGLVKNGNSGEPGTSRLREMPSDPPLEKDQRRREVNPVNVNLTSRIKSGRARLQIVNAFAHGSGDQRMVVNCLFDMGAEQFFIREDVTRELGLRGEKLSVTVHGFGGGSKELQESMFVHFHLSPLSGGPRKLIEAMTAKTLCDDIFQPRISARIRSPIVTADKSADTECDQLLRKFWVLEATGIFSEEEQSLSGLEREEFQRNLSFDGVRYTVRLLWKKNCSTLPNNYLVAQKRLRMAGSFSKPLFRNHNWVVAQRTLADEHIEWSFITERAPWCGGHGERLVRSVKVALTKVLGRSRADPEELRTVLCEIEARINDRPLTIVSDRADDDLALTPAHFLTGRELSALSDQDHHGRPVRGDSRSLTLLHRRWSARKVEATSAAAEGWRYRAGGRTEPSQESVGRDCSILAAKLGLGPWLAEIESAYEPGQGQTDRVLGEWFARRPSDGTVGALLRCLKEMGRDDAIDLLCRSAPSYAFSPANVNLQTFATDSGLGSNNSRTAFDTPTRLSYSNLAAH